jgi:hypothetical protein
MDGFGQENLAVGKLNASLNPELQYGAVSYRGPRNVFGGLDKRSTRPLDANGRRV